MSRRKEIVLDKETDENLELVSKVLGMNQSKAIKFLINATANFITDRLYGKVVAHKLKEEMDDK